MSRAHPQHGLPTDQQLPAIGRIEVPWAGLLTAGCILLSLPTMSAAQDQVVEDVADIAVPTEPDWQTCDRLDDRYAKAVERLGRRFARCAASSTAPVRYEVPSCAGANGVVPAQTYAGSECRSLKSAWCDGIVSRSRAVEACRERAMIRDQEQAERAELDRSVESDGPLTDRPRTDEAASAKSNRTARPSVVLDLPPGRFGQHGVSLTEPKATAKASERPLQSNWGGERGITGCWSASLQRSDFKEVLTYCLEPTGAVQAEVSALGTFRHPESGEATLFSATCPTGGRFRHESQDRFVIESFAASCSWTGRDAVLRRARFAEDTITCTLVGADEAHCTRRDRSGAGPAQPEPLVMTR